MIVYILEERTTGTDYDIVGVVSKREVADLFVHNQLRDSYPSMPNRRWREKWLDDSDLLYRISKEGK